MGSNAASDILDQWMAPEAYAGRNLRLGLGICGTWDSDGVTVFSRPFLSEVNDARGLFAVIGGIFAMYSGQLFRETGGSVKLLDVDIVSSKTHADYYRYVDTAVSSLVEVVERCGGSLVEETMKAELRAEWNKLKVTLNSSICDIYHSEDPALVTIVVRKFNHAVLRDEVRCAVYEVMVFRPRAAGLNVVPIICPITRGSHSVLVGAPVLPLHPYTFELIRKLQLSDRGSTIVAPGVEELNNYAVIPIVATRNESDVEACTTLLSRLTEHRGRVLGLEYVDGRYLKAVRLMQDETRPFGLNRGNTFSDSYA